MIGILKYNLRSDVRSNRFLDLLKRTDYLILCTTVAFSQLINKLKYTVFQKAITP